MPSAPAIIFTPPTLSPAAAPQCHEAPPAGKAVLQISGTLTSGVAGVVKYAGLNAGTPAWSTDGTLTAGASNVIVKKDAGVLSISLGSSYSATKTSDATDPVGLTGWTIGTGTGQPTVAAFATPIPPVITA